ncbi:N5-glutamine methyltransferase family protein [Treponema ruminis]|uniref:Release factor glutamine methyltransferase n=1 Tax=Treponema ruminis TaxID=744515 RepID=A0A7W8G6Q7_9SPIR|nr:HemK/PrmC family methyltransferase [Treponema ruminis]MBB5224874.1 release factor glutamine methyltransferase [Treponema ruminis]
MTIQQAKIYGKNELTSSPSPELDVAVLLQHITGFDKTHLLLNRDYELTSEQEGDFQSAIERRKTGFPIAYITGHKEFFGLDFYVTPDVLIPKPDTELLVELALDALEDKFRAKPDMIPTVCDMCTGSGCVALSIAKASEKLAGSNEQLENQRAEIKFTLVDISEKALVVARKNAERLLGTSETMSRKGSDERNNVQSSGGRAKQSPENTFRFPLSTFHFIRSNLFENVLPTFDLIVTNPPYVPHSESVELLKDGRSEPLLALDGDVDLDGKPSGSDDGLGLIRHLVPQCWEHLNRNGVLIMETGEYNAEETAELFKQAGFRNVRIEYDMNEMMRDVVGVK